MKQCYSDTEGRIVLVRGDLYGETVVLKNIYAPNTHDEEFFCLLDKIARIALMC